MTMGDDTEVQDAMPEVPWEEICSRLKMDARMELFLSLFQGNLEIISSIEALAQIPTFLGDYMIREFDYRDFCIALGTIDEVSANDDALWTNHMSKHLTDDLVAATSLMLRLAVTIAKAHQLELADWQDINDACSNAVRTLPACYRLQRALPGAMSVARAWKHLPDGPLEASAQGSPNPWSSDEAKSAFEDMFNFPLTATETIFENDKMVVGAFSGRFQVVEVNHAEGITMVSLEALHMGSAPAGFPVKPTASGDVILWEVEEALGSLIEVGFRLEADFYELGCKSCFISGFAAIAPVWAP